MHQQHVRQANHPVVGPSVGVGVAEGRQFGRRVEVLPREILALHACGVFRELPPIRRVVAQLVYGVPQARIHQFGHVLSLLHFPHFEFIHEVLGGQVEAIACEGATGTLEHVGVGAFAPKLGTPVASRVVGVLNFPDAARTVFTRFRENAAVVWIQEVLSRSHHLFATRAAFRPVALVEVCLGEQRVGCTTGGTSGRGHAVGALLRKIGGRVFEVCHDLGPDFFRRGAWLGVL